jgi:septal ring factor EnvC (AmiA/AmiB activator)
MSAVNHCNFIDHSIKRWVVMAFLCGVGLYSLQAQTQDKDALTAEKEKIEAQLATTSRLIGEAKNNRNAVNSQMTLINRQIELRERLIRHHQSSIRILEQSVLNADTEIRSLEGHIEGLKEEYAMMIQQAYRMQLANNPLMFVFAAEDFSQAALRFRMLNCVKDKPLKYPMPKLHSPHQKNFSPLRRPPFWLHLKLRNLSATLSTATE